MNIRVPFFCVAILSLLLPSEASAGPCKKSTDAFSGAAVVQADLDLVGSVWAPEPLREFHLKKANGEVTGTVDVYRKQAVDHLVAQGTLLRFKLADGSVVELASTSPAPPTLDGNLFTTWKVPVSVTADQLKLLSASPATAFQVAIPQELTQEFKGQGNSIMKLFACLAQ